MTTTNTYHGKEPERNSRNKLPLLLAALAAALLMGSCTDDDDDRIFNESAAQRMNLTVAQTRSLLEGSEYGWAMDYYPTDGSWGGYALTATFSQGKVTLRSEAAYTDGLTFKQYAANTPITSVYEMKGEQGPILSFSTYNGLIHYWSEPISDSSPNGCGGDCEFMLMSSTADELVFRGKKHGNTMRLVRLDEPAETYLQQAIATRAEQKKIPRLRLLAGNQTVGMSIAGTILTLNQPSDEGISTIPFTYTAHGLRLSDPVHVNGVELKEFELDTEGNLNSTSGDQAHIPYPSLGEIFLGASAPWYFDYWITKKQYNMCDELRDLFLEAEGKAEKQTYKLRIVGMTLGASMAYAKGRSSYPQCIGWESMQVYTWEPLYVSYDVEYGLTPDDLITITPIGDGAYFSPQNNPNYHEMLMPVADWIIGHAPYRVREGGIEGLTLESAADATCWFHLQPTDPQHWFD